MFSSNKGERIINIKQKFLNKVYNPKTSNETKELYKLWAKTYDEELVENKYLTPKRCAQALNQFADNKNKNVLDVGCGTGLSGRALLDEGFKNIDGTDFSEEMLNIASQKKIYKNLFLDDLNKSFSIKHSFYDYIVAAGIISPNHAREKTIDFLLKTLKTNGLFVFSLNDHALKEKAFAKKIVTIKNSNNFEVLQDYYGDHLKKINLKSRIFVIKKY